MRDKEGVRKSVTVGRLSLVAFFHTPTLGEIRMSGDLRAQLRLLRLHAVLSTVFILVLLVSGFRRGTRERFETIDVERINVVEKDGRVRLVIANLARSPAPIERGQPFGYAAGNRAGMIFYNEEGTEDGGLIFSGHRDSTGRYTATGSLTFDQYDQDQTVALQYVDENGRRRSGLAINDYALGLSSAALDKRWKAAQAMKDSVIRAESLNVLRPFFPKQRLYAGRGRDGASIVTLGDPAGRARLRLRVDSLGAASIEFLNDSGRVVRRLPE